MKLVGAALILLGCGGIGFAMVAAYRYQERTLRQLARVLNYMECELQYRMTPLPELCSNASKICTGCVGDFFLRLGAELDSQIAPDASACINAVVSRCTNIPDRLEKCLVRLGDSLGRFDLVGQLQGIGAVKRNIEDELEQLCRNQDVRLRSYQTLSLCAGAALVVLFL